MRCTNALLTLPFVFFLACSQPNDSPSASNQVDSAAVGGTADDGSAPPGELPSENRGGSCAHIVPAALQFGGKLVGAKAHLPVAIASCGTTSLVVTGIRLTEASSASFSLDFTSLPGPGTPATPTSEDPLVIAPGDQVTIYVVYVPSAAKGLGPNGLPLFDEATLVVESAGAEESVPVTGLGVDDACPTAVIVVQEGEQVIPQTNLHLQGDQSFAPSGAIASWRWSAKQPAGGASVFVPSDSFPNPTFEANLAGKHVLALDVWDQAGVKSCVPAEAAVVVVPLTGIHVDLTWHTPNDPDETDQGPESGSDVDLHLLREPLAATQPDLDGDGKPDGWFEPIFDCFWFQPNPSWGSTDPWVHDDPLLDRTDEDGAGPESLMLEAPEEATYRIGVHYWKDKGYGPSFVTLRIYIASVLVLEVTDVKLVDHDMWNAVTIDWPSAKVTLVQKSGDYWITPGYQNPFFLQHRFSRPANRHFWITTGPPSPARCAATRSAGLARRRRVRATSSAACSSRRRGGSGCAHASGT